jgi:hypothetical protein
MLRLGRVSTSDQRGRSAPGACRRGPLPSSPHRISHGIARARRGRVAPRGRTPTCQRRVGDPRHRHRRWRPARARVVRRVVDAVRVRHRHRLQRDGHWESNPPGTATALAVKTRRISARPQRSKSMWRRSKESRPTWRSCSPAGGHDLIRDDSSTPPPAVDRLLSARRGFDSRSTSSRSHSARSRVRADAGRLLSRNQYRRRESCRRAADGVTRDVTIRRAPASQPLAHPRLHLFSSCGLTAQGTRGAAPAQRALSERGAAE